jgi:hypothetical protein
LMMGTKQKRRLKSPPVLPMLIHQRFYPFASVFSFLGRPYPYERMHRAWDCNTLCSLMGYKADIRDAYQTFISIPP